MASGPYNRGKLILDKTLWESGSLQVLLVTAAYTFDPDHNFVSDLTGELTVAGYSRQVLGSPTATEDDTNNRIDYDAVDTLFAALAAGETIHGAVIFDNTGGADSARQLICFVDVPNTPTNGGDVTIQYATPIYRRT